MTDKKSSLFAGVENGTDKGPWYEGTAGERIAVRLSSTDTNGAYAIVESAALPFQGDPGIVGGTYPMRLVVFW